MEVISKIILSIIQGITGILPVSSTGHFLLANSIFDIEVDLAFLTFLHLATGIAIIWGFWDEIIYILYSKYRNYLIKIILLGAIPAGVAGILIHNYLDGYLHQPFVVIVFLILFGIVMILFDCFLTKNGNVKKLEDITKKHSFLVGLAQIMSLIPGTSRAGITIMAGLANGFNRRIAIAFSFLIGLPVIMGSFFVEIFKDRSIVNEMMTEENLISALATFVFAYFTILLFKKIANMKFLVIFGIYRILLALVTFVIISI